MHAEDYKIAYLYFAIHYYFITKYREPFSKNKNIYLENRYSLLGVMLIFIIKAMVNAK